MRSNSPVSRTSGYLTFLFMTLLLLSSCAGRNIARDDKATRIFEARVADLTAALSAKDAELAELRAALKLRTNASVNEPRSPGEASGKKKIAERNKNNHPAPRSAAPPEYEITDADFEEVLDEAPSVKKEETGVAIADSRHESLHLYFDATRLLEEKKFDAAVVPLNEFLRINPSHVYADHAQFLIAKSYFLNKEYELSVYAAKQLETLYPYSLKIPESLYVRGLSYLYLNQPVPARRTLENLRERFPTGPFSEAASKKLALLRPAADHYNRSVIEDVK